MYKKVHLAVYIVIINVDLAKKYFYARPVDNDFHGKKAIWNHNRKAALCTST